MTDIYQNKCRD